MALFQVVKKVRVVKQVMPQRQAVIVKHVPPVPDFLRHLNILCNNTVVHQLPAKMSFIADCTSHRGQAMTVYGCPICKIREGWVQDIRTGRPFRLFRGMPK